MTVWVVKTGLLTLYGMFLNEVNLFNTICSAEVCLEAGTKAYIQNVNFITKSGTVLNGIFKDQILGHLPYCTVDDRHKSDGY